MGKKVIVSEKVEKEIQIWIVEAKSEWRALLANFSWLTSTQLRRMTRRRVKG
jgi:hypothetical protein